jgi:tRNA 2-thiouridine synthesizing protein D
MIFTIMVSEGPYTHQASDSAYHFCRAALLEGHEICRVFFYHDGVYNATAYSSPPQDDRNVMARWADLSKQYDLDLVVCIAAAKRRGLAGIDEGRGENSDSKICQGFRISGLGQLIDGISRADRWIQFGD